MDFTFSATVHVNINEVVKYMIDILFNEYDDSIIDEAIERYAEIYHDKYEGALIMEYSSREKIHEEIYKILNNLIKK